MKTPSLQLHKHYGVVKDIEPGEVGPGQWTDVRNFQFQEGYTRRVGGYDVFADPISVAPLFCFQTSDQTTNYWIYCGQNTVYVTNGTSHFDITPALGLSIAPAGNWTAASLNGIPVLCNGINRPFYWDLDTSNACQLLPGWPADATCGSIQAYKFHLFAFDITQASVRFQDTVWWSEAAEPGTLPQEWVPASDNDAGDLILSDTPGAIVDALPLRDTLMVYKDSSTYALQYVGGQFVYTQRKVFLNQGIYARNCVEEIEGEHWVFTGTDVIRHNGQQSISVVQDKVKNTLLDSIDVTYKDYCCAVSIHSQSQFWICVPTQGSTSLDLAYVINTKTNEVGMRTLGSVLYVGRGQVEQELFPTQWSTDSQSWDQDITSWNQQAYKPSPDSLLMCAFTSSHLLVADSSDQNNNSDVYAYVERESLPITESNNNTLVTRVLPDIRGESGDNVFISVGSQSFFGESIAWEPAVTYTIGTDNYIDVQTEGRLFSIRFEATTSRRWSVYGYRLQTVDTGLF
ncbi:hypothetical protein [uncultured Paraglaciecola sp.]|uniref:hypothetical protein n=1 Tax=uncultured Paraglaciecola sp. TaxID=1765024 RepID=UPI002608D1C5|nr:hypothetical protein [uncultured Paraglaciecola sp.]